MSKNGKSAYQTSKIFDLDVFGSDAATLLNILTSHLKTEKALLTVVTPNPEQIVLSRRNASFLDQLQSADVRIPDGSGLVWASKLLAKSGKIQSLHERISGRETAEKLLLFANENQLTALVIGGREYGAVGSDSIAQLSPLRDHGVLNNTFWIEGYADAQQPTEAEEAAIESALKKLKPQIVFVALGAPWQEQWLMSHKAVLESAGVRLAMVVGGAFDILLGKLPAAPAWMQKLGLEWLYRLVQEPWRWRRQLKLLEFIKLTYQSM